MKVTTACNLSAVRKCERMKDVRRYYTKRERRNIERRREGRKERIVSGEWKDKISRGHWLRVQKILEKKKSGLALTKGEKSALFSFYKKCLKRNPTVEEALIGRSLSALNIEYVFQKQFGHYIVDFYLPAFDVVIEVDGPQHYTDKRIMENDVRRDSYLSQRGLKVIRVKNEELVSDSMSVLERIVNTITEVVNTRAKALKSLTESRVEGHVGGFDEDACDAFQQASERS
jgi:very-short-patch-repair endonuclease